MTHGWIGVDLDGTLAEYHGWRGADHLGDPIPEMLARVKEWIDAGQRVKIFTARVSTDGSRERNADATDARQAIERWCEQHLGRVLEVTNVKDYGMVELWDDRAVTVEQNTGRPLAPHQPRYTP
jgi:hypothetical protein